jgi:hypothetical protein
MLERSLQDTCLELVRAQAVGAPDGGRLGTVALVQHGLWAEMVWVWEEHPTPRKAAGSSDDIRNRQRRSRRATAGPVVGMREPVRVLARG